MIILRLGRPSSHPVDDKLTVLPVYALRTSRPFSRKSRTKASRLIVFKHNPETDLIQQEVH